MNGIDELLVFLASNEEEVNDAVEAHSCIDTNSECHLTSRTQLLILFNGRMFRPKLFVNYCTYKNSLSCKQLTKTFGSKRSAIE